MTGWILLILLNGTTSQQIGGFSSETVCRVAGAAIQTEMEKHVHAQDILHIVTTHYTCIEVK